MFIELKKNICKNNNNLNVTPQNFHCDFEKAIYNAILKIFPASNIKYCIWHYKRALEIQNNKICYNEVDEDNKVLLIIKLYQIFLLLIQNIFLIYIIKLNQNLKQIIIKIF